MPFEIEFLHQDFFSEGCGDCTFHHRMAKAYIGTSGWNYKHWSGNEFYPEKLKTAEWLQFFAQHFNTVEINNSFYRLPSEETFKKWRGQVPPDFVFAVKASRFLTHVKRLNEPEDPLGIFFSRARHLRDRLGPILFQIPPRFGLDMPRLETFLRALKPYKKIRSVIEVRDESWLVPPVFDVLRKYRVALCFADWRDTHVTEPVTSDFVYVRRHHGGAGGGNYAKADLDRDVKQVRQWLKAGLDVYFYFNNDSGGHAIRNAEYVRHRVCADRSVA